jgi:hypothetical protein
MPDSGRTVDRPLCLNAMSHPDSSRCPTLGQARAGGNSRTAPFRQFSDRRPFSRLWSTSSSSSSTSSSSSSKDNDSDVAPAPAQQQQAQEVSTMRSGDIRQELESYGISTKSFLEKKELVTALEQARAEGKKPIKQTPPKVTTTDEPAAAAAKKKNDSQKPDVDFTTTSSTTGNPPAGAAASDSSSTKTSSTASSKETDRASRMAEAMKKANAMKVGELKKTLQEMGISTKSMFEKTEFVAAYAEAVVNGVKSKATSSSSSSSSKGSSTGTAAKKEESYDPEYRTVVMQKMPRGDPRMLQGTVIDVTGR